MQHTSKLSGWKSIARHLGRSERTIQLWEAGRGLPVHRIPGTTGWTVYAYVEEVDAWMGTVDGEVVPAPRPIVLSVPVTPTTTVSATSRAPGVLVLPFENLSSTHDGVVDIDAYAEEIIAGLATHLPVLRVLSWTTSRKQRDGATSMAGLSRDLGVRYVIEGSVRHAGGTRRIDLRIVDAEIDRVLIVERFASSVLDDRTFRTLVVHNIVEHFSLVLAGALVERFHALEIDPQAHAHYLDGVRCFSDGSGDSLRTASIALERALRIDVAFAPALAMRALVHLELATLNGPPVRDDALATARVIAERCKDPRSARVTAAFLDATLAFAFDADRSHAALQFSKALASMPESIAASGRLYDRRSPLRGAFLHGADQRHADGLPSIQVADVASAVHPRPSTLFEDVMGAMTRACRLLASSTRRAQPR